MADAEMTEAEQIVEKVREMVSAVDMHRNREKREVLDAIRELVGVVEKTPEPEPIPEPEDEPGDDADGAADDDGLDDLSRAELNALAKAAGIDIKGKQADLIERLREHLRDEITSAEQVDAEIAAAEPEPTPEPEDDASSRAPRVAEDTE